MPSPLSHIPSSRVPGVSMTVLSRKQTRNDRIAVVLRPHGNDIIPDCEMTLARNSFMSVPPYLIYLFSDPISIGAASATKAMAS